MHHLLAELQLMPDQHAVSEDLLDQTWTHLHESRGVTSADASVMSSSPAWSLSALLIMSHQEEEREEASVWPSVPFCLNRLAYFCFLNS